jgi:hypothetical protein
MQEYDLAVFAILWGTSVAFALAAVTMVDSGRKRTLIFLWACAVAFLIAAVAWPWAAERWPQAKAFGQLISSNQLTIDALGLSVFGLLVLDFVMRRKWLAKGGRAGGMPNLTTLKRIDKLEQSPASATAKDHSKLVTTVVNLAKDADARVDRLSDSIEQIRGQLTGMHNRIESDRNHTASIFRILSTSLRARDAEAIIKEADEVATSVFSKLMTGGYPDEAAWTADYTIWRDAIGRIDGVVSSWQDHHRPYLAIGLKELEAGAPTPPPESNVTSSNGVMWYKTVWLVQQSYSNHRESMRRYFHAKAGELPG